MLVGWLSLTADELFRSNSMERWLDFLAFRENCGTDSHMDE